MLDAITRLKVMRIDCKIKILERQREEILSEVILTSKEHMEFYHG